jgi:hypothetical protein
MHLVHGTWIPREPAEFDQRGDFYLWIETDSAVQHNWRGDENLRWDRFSRPSSFHVKDASFIETMEELYGRVRAKSEYLK